MYTYSRIRAYCLVLHCPTTNVQVNRLGVKWFETRSVSSSRKSKISVRPRGFPWFSRTLPLDHRRDSLERSDGSRSGRPQPPMPAVAPSSRWEGC